MATLRLLVIVSGDFGELGAARYFLQGLDLAVPPRVLVPRSLAGTVPTGAATQCQVYDGLVELQRLIHEFSPDTVLLTSGYLLAVNSDLRLRDVFKLVSGLQRLRVTLLTSDPFLGARPNPARLAWADMRQRDRRDAFMGACVLHPLAWLLRNAWHLYPASIEALPTRTKRRCLAYFNPLAQPIASEAHGEPPTWLFVLSALDHRIQQSLARAQGGDFAGRLATRLRECATLGRQAVLIGPRALVRELQQQLAASHGISLRSEVPQAVYLQDLMAAEYAFFWNTLSFSILHRALAERPVFFFDDGHLARIYPSVWAAGRTLFYRGWQPPLLSLDQPMDERALSVHAADTRHAFRRIGLALRQAPSPAEVLRFAIDQPRA